MVFATAYFGLVTYYTADRGSEDFNGQGGLLAAGAGSLLLELLHVAEAAGEGAQAAVVVDQCFRVIQAQSGRPHQKDQDAGIEIAGAGGHGNAAGRGEPHGRINRAPALHRTQA